jgi:hypothetical protein
VDVGQAEYDKRYEETRIRALGRVKCFV